MSVTPIFLLSLPRSGSTLVQRVLAAHPQVATAAEPWVLLPHLYATRERGIAAEYTQPIAARAIAEFLRSLPNGERDYREALHDFVIDLYTRASSEGATYFLDKTPRYHYIVDDLLETFPMRSSSSSGGTRSRWSPHRRDVDEGPMERGPLAG